MGNGHVGDHADYERRVRVQAGWEREQAIYFIDSVENFGSVDVGVVFNGGVGFGGWGWRASGNGFYCGIFQGG